MKLLLLVVIFLHITNFDVLGQSTPLKLSEHHYNQLDSVKTTYRQKLDSSKNHIDSIRQNMNAIADGYNDKLSEISRIDNRRLPTAQMKLSKIPSIPSKLKAVPKIDLSIPDTPLPLQNLTPELPLNLITRVPVEMPQIPLESITANTPKSPEVVKEALQTAAKQVDKMVTEASTGLSGKEAMLKRDVDNIAKVQMKYRSFKDARYLPKHRYDELRGRPFLERFYISGSMQFDRQASNKVFVDVSPGIGYKLLSVFRVGAGASYRIDYNTKDYSINTRDRVIKIRGFADYKFFKNVFFHLEYERTHTKLPDYLSKQTGTDPSQVQWVPMAYVGIFKVQKLSKRISGQVTVLYDFLKVRENYNFNKVTSRIGLEYKLK